MKRTKDVWTVSRLKTFQVCPMKESLRYREKLAPIKTRSALAFGTAIHKGLETRSIEEALDVLDGIYPKDQEEQDELDLARCSIQALLTNYFERYPAFEEHEPEKLFKMPMKTQRGSSTSMDIAGKIDDLAKIDGRYWIVEYKTASRLDSSYFDRLYVDSQITMYMYAMTRLGYDVAGVIYRVIRKPALRRMKNETIKAFLDRITEDIAKRPEFYFEERQLYRSKDDLKQFERDLYLQARLSNTLHKSGCSFQYSTACSMYGACEYLPLCMNENGADALFEYREPNEELKE